MLLICEVLPHKAVGMTLGLPASLNCVNHTLPTFTHPNSTYCVPGVSCISFYVEGCLILHLTISAMIIQLLY
jgi:hypothetical protein